MKDPQFSIITVTKDNLFGLRKTFDSLDIQTYTDYEWIVVDGKSSDDTLNFLKNTNAFVISEPDDGIYDAMNKGIEKACGDYFIFMNAGDTFSDPVILEYINRKIIELKPDFIYGDSVERTGEKLHHKKSRSHKNIHQGMFTHHQSMIYARHLFDGLRYNKDYGIAADYDLTLQALQKSETIHHIPLPLCLFESGGISQQKVLQGRREQFDIRKQHGISPVKNVTIFLGQSGFYLCRRLFPSFYWRLKRA